MVSETIEEKFITEVTNNPEKWNKDGLNLHKNGKYKEAIECFDRAIEMDSKYTKAWNNKASTLYYLGKFEEAIFCYDKIIEISADMPEAIKAWRNKGNILFLQGEHRAVINCYDEVLKYFPNDSATRLKRENVLRFLSNKKTNDYENLFSILKNESISL